MPSADPVLLERVRVERNGTRILDGIDWRVAAGERWAVLGPNGAGKTTLLQVVTAALHPTAGRASVLGSRLGAVDVRELRKRIAVASGALTRSLDPRLTAADIVRTGRSASLAPWWEQPDPDRDRAARSLLAEAGLSYAADRPFSALSEGERQRTLLARMRMARAELWVFDEPAAGLDLGARERLVADLADLAASATTPAVVFVTHHLEAIPPGFTHALLLRAGRVVASGAIDEVVVDEPLSDAFGLALEVHRRQGRWFATAA